MKKVLYVLLALVVIYLILALIGPKESGLQKDITIARNTETVMPLLADLKFFDEKWNPWVDLDPAMTHTYTGEAGKIGHSTAWTGNKDVGSGKMEIISISKDTIAQKLTFEGRGEANVYLITKPAGDSTVVSWVFKGETPFFFRPVMLFVSMEKMMGGIFEKGLSKMKTQIESMPMAPVFQIVEVDLGERYYVGKREIVSLENNMEKLGEFFGNNYSKLMTDMGVAKIEPKSPPSAIYYNWSEKETDVAAVCEVKKDNKLKGYENFTLPAGKAYWIMYAGPDKGMKAAHDALMAHIEKNGKEMRVVLEEYVTDRGQEKDESKWITNIYYLVK